MDIRHILAGKATFTVVTRSDRKTFRVDRSNDKSKRLWFVKVLTGPDNTKNYAYIGCIVTELDDEKLSKLRWAPKGSAASPSSFIMENVVAIIVAGKNEIAGWEIMHAGRCMHCGRLLTHPDSIRTGMGPECASKA